MIEPCLWGIQCLWSTLVFLLEQPPYHYGSEVSGLFEVGVVGCGSTTSRKTGRQEQSELTVGLGLAITTGSFFIFVVWTSAMGANVGLSYWTWVYKPRRCLTRHVSTACRQKSIAV